MDNRLKIKRGRGSLQICISVRFYRKGLQAWRGPSHPALRGRTGGIDVDILSDGAYIYTGSATWNGSAASLLGNSSLIN